MLYRMNEEEGAAFGIPVFFFIVVTSVAYALAMIFTKPEDWGPAPLQYAGNYITAVDTELSVEYLLYKEGHYKANDEIGLTVHYGADGLPVRCEIPADDLPEKHGRFVIWEKNQWRNAPELQVMRESLSGVHLVTYNPNYSTNNTDLDAMATIVNAEGKAEVVSTGSETSE